MAIQVFTMGVLYSLLFKHSIVALLPHLTLGFLIWGLAAGMILEGASIFISSAAYITQMRRPLFTYVFLCVWRNLIVFFHNFVVYVCLMIILLRPPSITVLLVLVTIPLMLASVTWIGVLLAIISTRFRDVPMMVQSGLGIVFFLTPIIWMREQLAEKQIIADINPFTHVLDIVREPLLGNLPSLLTWVVIIGMTILGWSFVFFVFARYRARIAYWL